ncbi:MAG: 16S rRNA (guanine(527)-N(7))-methyltransferase RsmG [Sciscionella sp.]
MSSGPAATAEDGGLRHLAIQTFGVRLPLADQFAQLLSTQGIARGLIGPREAARVWDRHLLNCAALTELLPLNARVVDVGSGAGLPGLVLAIRRPDLRIDLVDSLQRRTNFLSEAVVALGLEGEVRVIHGRAEDRTVLDLVGSALWVTARAVAPLDRLVAWCLPLLAPGGRLLAIKGRSATQELAAHRDAVRRAGGRDSRVLRCEVAGMSEPISVVSVRRAELRAKKGSS